MEPSVPAISTKILDRWRSKLDAEKRHLAEIEAGRVQADKRTIRHLRRVIPKLQEIIRNGERMNSQGARGGRSTWLGLRRLASATIPNAVFEQARLGKTKPWTFQFNVTCVGQTVF